MRPRPYFIVRAPNVPSNWADGARTNAYVTNTPGEVPPPVIPRVLIYTGASLFAEGEGATGPFQTWPDSGTDTPYYDAEEGAGPNQLSRDYRFNDIFMGYGESRAGVITEQINEPHYPQFSFAGVMHAGPGIDAGTFGGIYTYDIGENSIAFVEYDSDGNQYESPGWWFNYHIYDDSYDEGAFLVAPVDVKTLAFACTIDVATGAFVFVSSEDMSPPIVQEDSFTVTGLYPLGEAEIGAYTQFLPDPTLGLVDYAEARFYWQGQDENFLTELIYAFRDTYGTVLELTPYDGSPGTLPGINLPRVYDASITPNTLIENGDFSVVFIPDVDSTSWGTTNAYLIEMRAINDGGIRLGSGGNVQLMGSFGTIEFQTPITWDEGQTITARVQWSTRTLIISGALTGNGSFPFGGAWTWDMGENRLGCAGYWHAGQEFFGTLVSIINNATATVALDLQLPQYALKNGWYPGTLMSTGKWSGSFIPDFDSSDPPAEQYNNILTFDGDGSFNLEFTGGNAILEVWDSGGTERVHQNIAFTGGVQVDYTFDFVARTLTLQGLTSGNGTYALGAGWTWGVTGPLGVGRGLSIYPWHGVEGNMFGVIP